jgi:hypothetical protein
MSPPIGASTGAGPSSPPHAATTTASASEHQGRATSWIAAASHSPGRLAAAARRTVPASRHAACAGRRFSVRVRPWPCPSASSACPTSARAPSSTPSPPARRRPPTIRSAPSIPTSASCRCRTAAAADPEAHPDPEGAPGGGRDRRHRRPGQGRVPGRGPGQQVPRQHPRDQRHPDDGPLLRRSQRGPRLGSVDPMRDIDIIELELVLADADTVEKRVKKAANQSKSATRTPRPSWRWPRRSRRTWRRQAAALARADRRRAGPGRDLGPDDRQAGAVLLQRRRGRPAPATRGAIWSRRGPPPRAPAWSSCAGRSRPSWPA